MAGLVTRGTTCGTWEYSETGLVGLRMSDSDKLIVMSDDEVEALPEI